MKPVTRQGARFLVAGGIATLADAVLFGLLVGQGIDPRISNLASYPLSAVLAFLLHRNWTFAAGAGDVRSQALRFAAMVVGGVVVSTAIIWILAPWLGPLPAKAVAISGSLTLNFTVSRWLVFAPAEPIEGCAGKVA